jgi:hypothetical protein
MWQLFCRCRTHRYRKETALKRIVIENEKQAFDVLEQALKDELGDQPYELAFKNWPVLEIRLTGKGYDSTITSDVAEAVVDVQRAVNRAYARTVHGTANARSLTDTERRDIQFKAKVKRGSSVVEIDLADFAEKLASAIVTKMTPEMLAITVIGLAVTGASLLAYKAYLAARTADKQIGQESIDKIALSKEETRRLEVFADAMKRAPSLAHARADFDEARGEIIRSGATANTLAVNNVEIDGETARVIGAARRAESEEVQLNGNYSILAVDLRQPNEVRLRIRNLEDGREFFASFNDHSLNQSQIGLLQNAEWHRSPVYLSINARSLRGEITVAKVVSVKAQPTAA